jgi:hypothetical protein
VKTGAPFIRTELAQELDRHQIGNRMLFGCNLLPSQPSCSWARIALRHCE